MNTRLVIESGNPYFKVMYSDAFNALVSRTMRRYVHKLPSDLRYWAVVSILHILNLEAKVLSKDILKTFHAKRSERLAISPDDILSLRQNYQKIYLEVLSILTFSKAPSSKLYKAYKNRLKRLDPEEFNHFVNSVLGTVAEQESKKVSIVSSVKKSTSN